MVKTAQAYNKARMYDSALAVFTVFDKKCTAKDARFKGGSEKAHALNGLGRFSEALDAANKSVKANKNWISGYFERAVAYAGLGMSRESKADYDKIIQLSSKNKDTGSRSSIFALLADIHYKQGNKDSAIAMLDKAISLKNDPDYIIQKGDIFFNEKDYQQAFLMYDAAVAAGKNDYEMYVIRSGQRLKMYQEKYGTDNVNELMKKMSAKEKELTCTDLSKLKSFGRKNLSFDMTYAFLCQ
jgi:tetratricopeptide (TPR) repeat protein